MGYEWTYLPHWVGSPTCVISGDWWQFFKSLWWHLQVFERGNTNLAFTLKISSWDIIWVLGLVRTICIIPPQLQGFIFSNWISMVYKTFHRHASSLRGIWCSLPKTRFWQILGSTNRLIGMTGTGSGRTRSLPLMIGHHQRFEKAHVNLEILGLRILLTDAVENVIGTCYGFLSQFLFSSFSGYREVSP